jgi:hypothetical protein
MLALLSLLPVDEIWPKSSGNPRKWRSFFEPIASWNYSPNIYRARRYLRLYYDPNGKDIKVDFLRNDMTCSPCKGS